MAVEINIDKIMKEIRAEIKDKGLDEHILDFDDFTKDTNGEVEFDVNELRYEVQFAHSNVYIAPNRELTGSVPVKFVKKVIRKLCRFYVQPIVDDQNKYNLNILNTMDQFWNYICEAERKIEGQNKLIEQLTKEIEFLKAGR